MLQVTLDTGSPEVKSLFLRPICGHDEASINEDLPFSAVELIDRLLVSVPEASIKPEKAWDLAIADRDRILAAIYQQYFGDQIEGTTACQSCGENFELNFSLNEIINQTTRSHNTTVSGPNDNAEFTMSDGTVFRLPNSNDLKKAMGQKSEKAEADLLKRCIVNSPSTIDGEKVQSAMQQASADLSFDMDAICPHCNYSQSIYFDIESYVIGAFSQEKQYLDYEIHHIAMAYGWSLAEILDLTREQRRKFVKLIGSDSGADEQGGML